MKKLILGVALFLLSSSPVLAVGKSVNFQSATFYQVTGGSSDSVTTTPYDGYVKIGTPGTSENLLFSGVIKGLNPSTEYFVWVRELAGYTGPSLYSYLPLDYYKLTSFTTDATGYGTFNYTIDGAYLSAGTYPIQVAINYAPSDPIGQTVAATVKYTNVILGPGLVYPGCNQPGTTFVGQVPNPGDPSGPNWNLVMHGSYVLGRCGGTGPGEGDWNVQRSRGPDGSWEYYKNVFTSQDIFDTGAYPYWDITADSSYSGTGYHPLTCDGTHFCWWIIKSNGVSPFMEPFVNGGYQPADAQPNGFGFYK